MVQKTYNVGEAKANLSEIIEMVVAGQEIIISKRNHPVVKLSPLIDASLLKDRVGGQLRGQITIPDDFDELPQDILDAFEGKNE